MFGIRSHLNAQLLQRRLNRAHHHTCMALAARVRPGGNQRQLRQLLPKYAQHCGCHGAPVEAQQDCQHVGEVPLTVGLQAQASKQWWWWLGAARPSTHEQPGGWCAGTTGGS